MVMVMVALLVIGEAISAEVTVFKTLVTESSQRRNENDDKKKKK